MYISDKEIEKAEDDLLGRATFSKNLAKTILELKTSDCMVIGLFGQWGSGKSSIINMMLEEINNELKYISYDSRPIIYKFSPWNFTSNDNLIIAFFKGLREKLKVKDYGPVIGFIGKLLDHYCGSLADASKQSLNPIAKIIGVVFQILGKFVNGKYGTCNLEKSKDKLSEALGNQNHKIIVVIDDIDRLCNEQIRMIFQLVKQVGCLPNIVYILSMDKDVVVRALEDVQNYNGENYLEKIIQVPFEIPELNRTDLRTILLNHIKDILKSYPDCEIDNEHLNTVYFSCIYPYILNIRDINRLINVFQFKLGLLVNEVDFVDLLAITILELKEPRLLEWIKGHKSELCGGSYDANGISMAEQDINRKKYIEIFTNMGLDTEKTIQAVASIFPKLDKSINYRYDLKNSYELRGKRRIASVDKFDIYFSLDLSGLKVTNSMVRSTILDIQEENLEKTLLALNTEGKIIDYLEELRGQLDSIPYDRLNIFIRVLYRIKHKLKGTKNNDLFMVPADSYAEQCISELSRLLKLPEERYEIYSELIRTGDIYVLSNLCVDINRIELAYGRLAGKSENENKQLITLKQLQYIEIEFAKRMKKLAAEDSVFEAENLNFINYLWENFAPEDCDEYYKNKLVDETTKLKFITKIAGEWFGSDGKGYSYSTANYGKYLDKDEVYNIIAKYDKKMLFDRFTDNEILKLAFFKLNYPLGEEQGTEEEARAIVKQWANESGNE